MAITSRLSTKYALRMLFLGVLSVVFGLWGIYDLVVTIPAKQKAYDDYQKLVADLADLEQRGTGGAVLTPEEKLQYEALEAKKSELGEKVPSAPRKFDRLTQWFFITCLPCAPYFFWLWIVARRKVYTLDDDGTLHLPEGTWARHEIADIDMSRWMAKSIAHVVHRDGSRVKLDDYIHKNLHLIVGALASRMYPDQWTPEARLVTPQDEAEADAVPGADGSPADELAGAGAIERSSATTGRGDD